MSIVAVSSKRSVDLRVTRRAGAVADEYVAIAEYSSATVGIRIVADFGTQIIQFMMKLKRATTLEFTTISAIIFILCCTLALFFLLVFQCVGKTYSFAIFGQAVARANCKCVWLLGRD